MNCITGRFSASIIKLVVNVCIYMFTRLNDKFTCLASKKIKLFSRVLIARYIGYYVTPADIHYFLCEIEKPNERLPLKHANCARSFQERGLAIKKRSD